MYPATADAATTSGDPKYACALGDPIRPLKFLLVAEMPTSPSCKSPTPSPIHGPHPGGSGFAPAATSACQSPLCSLADWTSLDAAAIYISTPSATFLPRKTPAAAFRSSNRAFTQDNKYALCIFIFWVATCATEVIFFTLSGPETWGDTLDRSRDKYFAYTAPLSAVRIPDFSASICCWFILGWPPWPSTSDGTPARPRLAIVPARFWSQSNVTPSIGKTPARAPHSVVMLAIANRSFTDNPATPSPANSTA